MSKSLKKILITGASLLMFASIGAGGSNINANARFRRTYRVHRHHSTRRKGNQIKHSHKRTSKHLKRNHNYYKRVHRNTKKRGHKNYLPRKFFGKWYARRGSLGGIKQPSGSANIGKHGDYINLSPTASLSPSAKGYMNLKKNHGVYSDRNSLTYIKLINHGKTLYVSNDDGGYPVTWRMHRV